MSPMEEEEIASRTEPRSGSKAARNRLQFCRIRVRPWNRLAINRTVEKSFGTW